VTYRQPATLESVAGKFYSSRQNLRLSIVLPTFNERSNAAPIAKALLALIKTLRLEILFVDDDSADGTADEVRRLAHQYPEIRLIRRVGRAGLSSAIKEGILAATGDFVAVMDCDGQHEPEAVVRALDLLLESGVDLVVGSRFHKQASILGLCGSRQRGSSLANRLASRTLPVYRQLSDYMSGFCVLRLDTVLNDVRAVDVNGFKFLYELLAVSQGRLTTLEIPLNFKPRQSGDSKLDFAIVWDFGVSVLHTLAFRLIPRRMISFALVGASGVLVQLSISYLLRALAFFPFAQSVFPAALVAATSNYLINNALTFRFQRQRGLALAKGLARFLLVASLPVLANVGIATTFYARINPNPFWAQLAGIIVVFIWNYAASSRFVWNSP
jgi:dolichol-phosphate mannosyltransferase